MDFLGMGFGEIALILLVALLIFGPGKLVNIARSLGNLSHNIKRMSTDFTSAVTKEVDIRGENPDKTHPKPQNNHQGPAAASNPGADAGKTIDTETSDSVGQT